MIFAVVARHVLFGAGLALISAGLTWLMLRARIMDIPNQRSSHLRPVPNGGGVAIVTTFFVGYAALYLLGNTGLTGAHMAGFALAALGIAAVGFFDDLGRIRTFVLKLMVQVLAACILVAFGIVFRTWSLPWVGAVDLGSWGYVLTVVWVVALTNIVNFMDGLDGLAGGTCAIAALFLGLVTAIEGSLFVYLFCYVIAAAALGFLAFNFPRARIFMGDVGSQFLGFVIAALAIIAAEHDASRTSFLVVPLLFFHFIFDTAFTMARRALRGELCSFFFAYTGEFCPGLDTFFGAPIEDGFGVPSVPASPGSALVLAYHNGRVGYTHVRQRDAWQARELDVFREQLAADLVG